MFEFIILGFLMSKNMTGYDIKQKMSVSTSNFIDASFGSIYPALKRLEQKALICSEEVVTNGKLKKVYFITQQGKDEFLRWLSAPIEASKTSITSALSKIFFYNHLSNESAQILLHSYIADLTTFKSNLLKVKETIAQRGNTFELCTLLFGLDFYDFAINWYQNYLANLDKNNK